MPNLSFNGIGIKGLSGAVPSNTITNYEYTACFSPEVAKEITDKTGIYERRFAPPGMCASDLCYQAAEKLLSDMEVDRSEITLLIFVSQTPDYRMPATSIVLQDRLGLGKNTMAFDISLGCSAFVYALSVVYGLMQSAGIKKALLLDGETRSRIYSPKDRTSAFIFGDAGVAALIERDENYGDSHFSLNSDGSRSSLIKMDAGGYRNPSSSETLKDRVVDDYGNIRSQEHGYMNGADVFNFVLREVPKDIKSILSTASVSMEEIDYCLFHQANKYMNDFLIKKMKVDVSKVPTSIHKFGNTSSVSIPITIASELKGKLTNKGKMLLCGFGVGMSWASAVLNYSNCHISELVEV